MKNMGKICFYGRLYGGRCGVRFGNASKRLNVPMVVIECVMKDEALHRKRLEARVRGLHGFDEMTWECVQERKKAYTPWKQEVLTLEMSENYDRNLQLALDFIARY